MHALAAVKQPAETSAPGQAVESADGAAESKEMSPRARCTAVGSWRCAEGPVRLRARWSGRQGGGQLRAGDAPGPQSGGPRECYRAGRAAGVAGPQEPGGDASKPELNFLYTSAELGFEQRVPGVKFVFT